MAYEIHVYFNCNECGEQSEGIEPEYGFPDYSGEGGQYLTTDRDLERLASKNGFTIDDDCAFCEECAPLKGL